ncbi:MAG: protease complex subunit PrcB family protein [Gammaproteobacteria bacterium]|nr:protease complex subunit PrcB family protein [Gammaproteobacteria bacterium]
MTLRSIAMLAALSLVSGCTAETKSAQTEILPVRQLYASGDCGRADPEPAAKWITQSEQWEAIHQRLTRQILPQPSPPAVDFEKSGVLLVEAGQRPTAGYRLALTQSTVERTDSTARITLDWKTPPADAMTAQVLTSPCVMIELPKARYSSIQVLDLQGNVRLEISL